MSKNTDDKNIQTATITIEIIRHHIDNSCEHCRILMKEAFAIADEKAEFRQNPD